MRILGVDPGSYITGWGLLGGAGNSPMIIDCGIIKLARSASFPVRLGRLGAEFRTLVDRLSPDEACVESAFHGINARAALQLAHARGVILAVLGEAGVPVEEYSPAAVKKAVTGNGRAAKQQVKAMTSHLLGDHGPLASADVSDALAIAYCHTVTASTRKVVENYSEG